MSESLTHRVRELVERRGLDRGIGFALMQAGNLGLVATVEGVTDEQVAQLNEAWLRSSHAIAQFDPSSTTAVRWERRVPGTDVAVEAASYDVDDQGHVVLEEALVAQLLLDAGWERTS